MIISTYFWHFPPRRWVDFPPRRWVGSLDCLIFIVQLLNFQKNFEKAKHFKLSNLNENFIYTTKITKKMFLRAMIEYNVNQRMGPLIVSLLPKNHTRDTLNLMIPHMQKSFYWKSFWRRSISTNVAKELNLLTNKKRFLSILVEVKEKFLNSVTTYWSYQICNKCYKHTFNTLDHISIHFRVTNIHFLF